MNSLYVLYHGDCSDGLGAAYALWCNFGYQANYIPVNHGESFPNIEVNKYTIIYIVDFHYSKEIILELRNKVKQCVIIDHHITSLKELKGVDDFICDINKSACVLTWEYMHPHKKVPKLLLHAQDRDLQQFKYPETKALFEGMWASGYMLDFTYWQDIINQNEIFIKAIETGFTLISEQNVKLQKFISNSNKFKVLSIDDKIVAVYNTTVLIEEMAEKLIEHEHLNIDYTIGYHITGKGKIILSLRSKVDSGVNVETVAIGYGGGGHKHSSGATLHLKDSLKFLSKIYDN